MTKIFNERKAKRTSKLGTTDAILKVLTEFHLKDLKENSITEVYSNGVMVWSEGKMSDEACADFRPANYEYERKNSDAL